MATWTPDSDRINATNLASFAASLDVPLRDIHAFSIEQPERFWAAIWDTCEIIGDRGERVIEPGPSIRTTRFFPDARLNYAENMLRRDDDGVAMYFRPEGAAARDVSFADLHALVSRLQQALVAAGVEAGDRVAAWLPNMPETYAVMLAASSIGAVFSSCSPDFGVDGVLDRFGQIEPKVLFGVDGYHYGGKTLDCLEKLSAVTAALPSLERTVIVPLVDPDAGTLDDFLEPHAPRQVTFERLPFDHPLFVLYSSGTTGKPKCIVHRSGGILVQHLKEHRLHADVHDGDRVFYFTTAGWMMWNWLASALGSNASIVLYDGSPFHPDGNRLFDLVDEVGITLFGVSAKFIEAVSNDRLRPRASHDLSTLRTLCSTGSPLIPEGFDYIWQHLKPDLHIASISGGTDLCGCLVAGDPTATVHAGEIQGPTLGLDVAVVTDDGSEAAPGQQGELVCRNAFPSTPLQFWDDPDHERYDSAYFERFEGMWHQGDFAERTVNGGFVIHGRSDATLNPGGVRIGTAEIYRQLDHLDDVLEGLVVGQQVGGDTRVVLFVRLRDGVELTDELIATIKSTIRSGATPRHVPAVVASVDDLPRTRSGKIVELAVRNVIHGRPVTNTEALANPEALELFRDRTELD